MGFKVFNTSDTIKANVCFLIKKTRKENVTATAETYIASRSHVTMTMASKLKMDGKHMPYGLCLYVSKDNLSKDTVSRKTRQRLLHTVQHGLPVNLMPLRD